MTIPLLPVEHVDNAEGNFLDQYQDSPLFIGFTNAFLQELNALEEQFTLFQTITVLSHAEGVNLTKLGRILGARTRPVADAEMRALLYALIGAYNSEGTPENIRALVIQTVQADAIFIEDLGGGVFSFTIFNGNFTFGIELLYDIVNLAKPVGVELDPFKLASFYSDATFSFLGDPRPGSEGFALAIPRSTVTAFYDDYAFPAAAAVATSARVSKNVTTNLAEISFVTTVADGNAWATELASKYVKVDGTMGFNVGVGAVPPTWTFVCIDPSLAYRNEVVGGYMVHTFTIDKNGVTYAHVFKNDVQVSRVQVLDEFPVLTDVDAGAWATNNASGLGWQYTSTGTLDPLDYGVRDGGRYAISITSAPMVFANTPMILQLEL